MRYFLCVFLGAGLSVSCAHARPVSYPGGWTFITENHRDSHSTLIHYSPTAKTAIGHRWEYRRDQKLTINALQINTLLKRWNAKHSQANLYLKSGLGIAYHDQRHSGNINDSVILIGLATDWENRRFFLSCQNRYIRTGNRGNLFTQSARVGIAPYIGDYGDLHTWLMLEIRNTLARGNHTVSVTPLVRIFKNVHLLEAGISNRKKILFNYIFRY